MADPSSNLRPDQKVALAALAVILFVTLVVAGALLLWKWMWESVS